MDIIALIISIVSLVISIAVYALISLDSIQWGESEMLDNIRHALVRARNAILRW